MEAVGARFRFLLIHQGGHPCLVGRLVLLPGFILAAVVVEVGLADHGYAVGNRADCFAYAAAATGFHVGVVQPVGRNVETGVGTLQPAECALDAGLEVNHRPHGAGAEFLEHFVPVGLEALIAAAEAAVGLAIIVIYYKNKGTIHVEQISSLKG